MPQGKHSTIRGEIVPVINHVTKPKRLARAILELRRTLGDRSTVPDIAVFAWNRIPPDQNGEVTNSFVIAPECPIEILSPNQSQTKVTKNILHCLKHRTQAGWLIDPREKTVFVLLMEKETAVFDQLEALLPVPSFANELL